MKKQIKADIVSKFYQIDEDELHIKAQESEYWESCERFYLSVKDKNIKDVSEKQIAWLEKIVEAINP